MKWTPTHTALVSASALALLAIVAAPFISPLGEMVDPTLAIEVESHEMGGPEVLVLTDHHLETLVVNASMGDGVRGFPVSIYHFYATSSTGKRIWCSGLVDEMSLFLEPGDNLSFGIYFEVPDGDTIISVEYRKPSGDVISAPVLPV